MRCILCVKSYLLDGWTDLHETLGLYTTRPGLLQGVFFYFRSELHNRKICYFWWTGSWKYRNRKSKICLMKREYNFESTILLFRYFNQGRRQRLLKNFASYVRVYTHTRKKWFLWPPDLKNNITKIELPLQKSTSFRTRYFSTSGSNVSNFRFTKNIQFPVLRFRPEVEKYLIQWPRLSCIYPQSFMKVGKPV